MKKIAIIALFSLIVSACFSPYRGDESAITINFGGGARAVYPDPGHGADEFLPYLEHQITLTGPNGTIKRTVKGGGSVKLYVPPGTWNVKVDDTCGGIPFASGTSSTSIEVKAGETVAVPIYMTPDGGTIFHTVNNINWNNSIGSIGIATGNHCIILAENIITSYAANFINPTVVTIIGNGKTITFTGTYSPCITVNSGPSVTIKDVHFNGNKTNTIYLIYIDSSANFTMQGNSSISGNGSYGIYVNNGDFTMDGGRIFGNTASGVYLDTGTFTMNGGTISGNTKRGVEVTSGDFTMNGGTISGNTGEYGGGVYFTAPGRKFIMNGGTISGNSAIISGGSGGNGGGVYVEFGTFIMSGGTISNNTAAVFGNSLYVDDGNIATYGSGALIELTPDFVGGVTHGYVNAALTGKK